jgi:hypothetical protein
MDSLTLNFNRISIKKFLRAAVDPAPILLFAIGRGMAAPHHARNFGDGPQQLVRASYRDCRRLGINCPRNEIHNAL